MSRTIVGGWKSRLHWGVAFTGSRPNDGAMLLGQAWLRTSLEPAYPGAPTRPLLFQSRRAARAYCKAQHGQYAGRTDCCGQWRFRPVRVRETFTVAA